MDDLTKEFLAESFEGLDRMDRCLTELESKPNDAELLDEIFRSVHTIKGDTGFLGFTRLENLAHAGENLLGSLREGRLTVNRELVGGLLNLTDGLRAILRLIETTGKDSALAAGDDSVLIAWMDRLEKTGAEPAVMAGRSETRPVGEMSGGVSEKTLRIDAEVLNRMMNLVGELVLTRNQILQSRLDAEHFPELARRLDCVTADLRETVMQARMQPLGYVFQKFPRLVRDLALACGKRVRIEFSGQETALDRGLLEAIKDPLTHAVRNAIDHGIETPERRAAAGKPAEGAVKLRAYQQNGSVVIEVADDGGGILVERVLAKAIERGLITEEEAAAKTAQEALRLIFLPGFSTAAEVTNISGRGVGMDVVRANVEKVGGSVDLESREGVGTLLRMRVPLTLAIVRALIVRSGGQSFCVPQSQLTELVYVPWRDAEASIERIGAAEVYRLRERLLPMVRLDEMLGLGGTAANRQEHGFYLVVMEADGCRYGLVVDDLMSPEEIVVKPLSPVLREIGLFSGATVLGSGSLAMILDSAAIGLRAGVKPIAEEKLRELPAIVKKPGATYVIYEERGAGRQQAQRLALPLSRVERIETVAVRQIEYAGGRPLLQYRGELLPLEDTGGVLEELGAEARATVLICQEICVKSGRLRRMGMIVRRVLEVSEGALLENEAQVCPDRLALVSERLTMVHESVAASSWLREVA